MAAPGRNDPCPCGRGKKYKKCCALVAGVSTSAARLHALDEVVIGKLATLMRREGAVFGGALVDIEEVLTDDPDLPLAQLLVPTAFYELPAAFVLADCALADEAGELCMAAHFLAEDPGQFEARERAWIQAQTTHGAKIWEVTGVEPGVALHLRDPSSGETRRVLEKLGSENMRLHATLFARVIDFEGLSVFCGLYPRTLSPRGALVLREMRAELEETPTKGEPWLAAARRSTELLVAFAAAVREEDARVEVPPTLQNTDGDLLLTTKDRFSFPASRRKDVLTALSSLDRCDVDEESEDKDVTRFQLTKAGNRQHGDWDNTVIGQIDVRASALILETNSIERADALAAKLEHALAGIAKRGLREHEDPMVAIGRARERGPMRPAEPMPPEARAAVEKMILEQEAAWPDLEIPALGGKTPRKAVKTKKGRAEVELLLKEMEHRSAARGGDGLGFDAKRLRAALGL